MFFQQFKGDEKNRKNCLLTAANPEGKALILGKYLDPSSVLLALEFSVDRVLEWTIMPALFSNADH
jgi:hypothetical protein